MTDNNKIENLKEELRRESLRYRRIARIHTALMASLYVISIAASFAASILVASDYLPRMVAATIAALPGAALLCTSAFRFKDHAQWHFIKARRIENCMIALKYEGASIEETCAKLRSMHEEMETTWPNFGKIGHEEVHRKHIHAENET